MLFISSKTSYCYGLAVAAHEGQYRKFTGEDGESIPYIKHIDDVIDNLFVFEREIVEILGSSYSVDKNPHVVFDQIMIPAATLHDTIEDTQFTQSTLKAALDRGNINSNVLELVCVLTNGFQNNTVMSRNEKLRMYMANVTDGPLEARLVKLMDILSNAQDAHKGSKEWKQRFVREKRYMVDVILDSLIIDQNIEKIRKAIFEEFDKLEKSL